MVVAPATQIAWNVVQELDKTERGSGGYGSTGIAAVAQYYAGLTPPKAKRSVILGRKGHDSEHVALLLHDMQIPPHEADPRW